MGRPYPVLPWHGAGRSGWVIAAAVCNAKIKCIIVTRNNVISINIKTILDLPYKINNKIWQHFYPQNKEYMATSYEYMVVNYYHREKKNLTRQF